MPCRRLVVAFADKRINAFLQYMDGDLKDECVANNCLTQGTLREPNRKSALRVAEWNSEVKPLQPHRRSSRPALPGDRNQTLQLSAVRVGVELRHLFCLP
jgi:hypothetical protein